MSFHLHFSSVSFQVILGGGRQYMFPKTIQDPEYPSSKGSRKDGQDLVAEWHKTKKVNGRFRSVLMRFEC